MPDREKIINGLEWILNDIEENGHYQVSYYADEIRKAIALLRRQEPVEPDGDSCGECGYTVHRINYDGPNKEIRHEWFRFCPVCGKAVKWNE